MESRIETRRDIESGKRRRLYGIVFLFAIFNLFCPMENRDAYASTVCSKVKIEILQELTIERIAFDAKMVITNNMPDKDLTGVNVDVIINDAEGNDKGELFFIALPTFINITDVNGIGRVNAGERAEIHWLIIPSPGAGGSDPAGQYYWVGATLKYDIEGQEQVVTVNPDRITVKPEAQLILDYFTPYEVIADNPFTPDVEAPVPFPLAVRVLNDGYGPAKALKIESAQPKIVENNQGLLVDFMLLGASVNDSSVEPSLTVNIGDLESKRIASAHWEMISTLSGKFTEFDVSFTHTAELGGELTSLIKETNAYYFIHKVKVNLLGRDDRLDILADTDMGENGDPDRLPDTIFESEIPGNTGVGEDSKTPVTALAVISVSGRPTALSPEVDVHIEEGATGWIYARLPDPGAGMLELMDVIRADGVRLDLNNFWISEGFEEDNNYRRTFTVHLLDYRAGASTPGGYTLVYEKPLEDYIPPVTYLRYDGPAREGDPVFITPETRIIATANDNEGGSGIDGMFRKISDGDTDFVPAYPFYIDTLGDVTLEYYSSDRAGNEEAVRTTYFYVDNAAPEIIAYRAAPEVFSPHAPRGVSVARTADFEIKASDQTGSFSGTIDIFDAGGTIVRTLEADLVTDADTTVSWDGRDKEGKYAPTGEYTAVLAVTDGLDTEAVTHTSTSQIQITVAEWFKVQPLDPKLSGEQKYPEISGTKVVWQDNRNGNWDIYMKDITGGGSVAVATGGADQSRPDIDGDIVVWQDNRNGDWDIYGYNIATGKEFTVSVDTGNQERPVISGYWIAWQDDGGGNRDIHVYNMTTGETTRVTDHERDQINPAISGNILAWEDYRHGLGEIYTYDLDMGEERRRTYNIYTQTYPAVSGDIVVWTDRRNERRDIYFLGDSYNESRITYGAGDHSQATALDKLVVYTDYENGLNNPDLSFYEVSSGIGARLTSDPSRQEEPSLGPGQIVWQDDRDGIYRIYWADFEFAPVPLEIELKPGFNLIAAGVRLADAYPNASDLIGAGLGIEKIVTYNSLNGIFIEAPATALVLKKGMGLGVYAAEEITMEAAHSGETMDYTLLPGTNYIGILTAAPGYRAYDLIRSIGAENIQSVRRYDTKTGLWETAAVRDMSGVTETVGPDFHIHSGDGLIITMKNRLDGWRP